MTKHRPPLSVEQAINRISGELGGPPGMAALTNRKPGIIRAWADPARREKISIDDAIILDLAFQAAGGIGAPLHEAYSFQLELAEINRFADRHQLGQLAPEILRECGEAGAALIQALLPTADRRARTYTRTQVEEAIAALTRAIPLLNDDAPEHQTGPPATAD